MFKIYDRNNLHLIQDIVMLNMYNTLLVRHLSMEGVTKDNDHGQTPTPDGEVRLKIKVGDNEAEIDAAMSQLDSIVSSLKKESFLTAESHLPQLATQALTRDTTQVNNYVVNGVFLPDYVVSETSDVRVHVIDLKKRMVDMDKTILYYVVDDTVDDDIVNKAVKELNDLGFYAVSTPLDLAAAIDKYRIVAKQKGQL